jgi:hypothetical protein
MGEPEPCPCETKIPPTSPGPVEDHEVLVRFVEFKTQVGCDETGRIFLLPAAVRQDDIKGKAGRSFSIAREAHTDGDHLCIRALARTQEEDWKQNPVLARTHTKRLREIVDGAERREVCVNSDPTTAEKDPLGAFPGHASALRSDSPKDKKEIELRQIWLQIRTAVGDCFDDIRHADGSHVAVQNVA